MDANIQNQMKQRMDKSIAALKDEFVRLRTGRASTSLLEGIKVEAYGSSMPVNQVATLTVPDSRTIALTPFDKTIMGEIEKAILKANLGLTPVNDGKLIRISIPALTEERRKEIVKMAKKATEEARVSIRNIRRDINEMIKKMKDKISEDDFEKWETEVQKATDQHIAQVDSLLQNKERDIMEV